MICMNKRNTGKHLTPKNIRHMECLTLVATKQELLQKEHLFVCLFVKWTLHSGAIEIGLIRFRVGYEDDLTIEHSNRRNHHDTFMFSNVPPGERREKREKRERREREKRERREREKEKR